MVVGSRGFVERMGEELADRFWPGQRRVLAFRHGEARSLFHAWAALRTKGGMRCIKDFHLRWRVWGAMARGAGRGSRAWSCLSCA